MDYPNTYVARAVNFDSDAPGRGPGHMGELYRWDRIGDLPIVGRFAGVVLGTRKGADTLQVGLEDETYIPIRYEQLAGVHLIDDCPECELTLLVRSNKHKRQWICSGCGYAEERDVEITNPIRNGHDRRRRLAQTESRRHG